VKTALNPLIFDEDTDNCMTP